VGVILGLAVAVSWGSGDLLATLAARGSGAFRTLAIAQMTELALCIAAWAFIRPPISVGALSVGVLLLAGAVTAASYGALYQGLMLGPVMLVGPIASAYAVGPTILAVVLLGERLSIGAAMGSVVAIGGVVMVTVSHASEAANTVRNRSGVPFGIAAMIGFAASAFGIAASAQALGWLPPLLISRIGVAVTIALAAPHISPPRETRDRTASVVRASTLLAALAGLCNLAGTALYAHAGELQMVAIVTAVSALFPLVPVLGGFLLFHERVRRVQLVGIGAVILGLVLLA
jgi:drug/metabolite transporter (DMT)-like permease